MTPHVKDEEGDFAVRRRNNVWKPRRSLAEQVGRVVLFPIKLGLLLIALPFLVLAYPVVAVYILFVAEGSLTKRVKYALLWPFGLLALNDLLSLGGLDIPALSRINDWLSDRFNKQ